jgi:glutamate racemase
MSICGRLMIRHTFLLMCAMASNSIVASAQQDSLQQQVADLVHRDSIKVLVTDSGLGGLSVCAAIDSLAASTGRYSGMQLIFANALPDSGSGYNRMKTIDEKVKVFNDALNGMVNTYRPDLILIACNTLSVVYPHTPFSRTAGIPVVGIVSMGVDLIAEELHRHPGSRVIVFGTETTIGAGTHKRLLVERGVPQDQIAVQACSGLAGEIERDAHGQRVEDAITRYVAEAMGTGTPLQGAVAGALCCTHYGYAAGLFRSAIARHTTGEVTILDPNMRMARMLFPPGQRSVHASPRVNVQVVSRAVITPEEMQSIGSLLRPVSERTAAALHSYELKRDLFPFLHE